MLNSKLIELYTCLNRKELEAFNKWLRSPLHNTDGGIVELFDYVASRRKITELSVNKKRIYKYLFPQTAYNDLQLRRLMSKATVSLEEFVQFWMSKKDKFEQKQKLTQFLRERQKTKQTSQQLEKSKQVVAQNPFRNHQYFYQKYQFEQAFFEQEAAQNRMKETNLQAIFDSFSTAFIIENLRYACIAISHQNLYKTVYRIPFLKEMLIESQALPYKNSPTVQMYYQAYMALTRPNEISYFEALKVNLIAHEGLLPTKERRNLYTLAINYCIKKINSAESEKFIREVFEVYKRGLENKILLDNGVLSRFTYKNVVTAGLRLEEYTWVEKYIPIYATLVSPQYRDSYEHYNTSKLQVAKGNYEAAMLLLIQVEYDDLFLNLDAKTMLMKIYYEEESWDALVAFFHSFTIYLQRKEIMGYHRQNYLNIIRLMRKLLDLKPREIKPLQELTALIENTQPLTERVWLLEQIKRVNQNK